VDGYGMEDLGESRLTLYTTGDHTTLVHSTPLIKSRPSVDSSLVRGGVLEVWRRRPESSTTLAKTNVMSASTTASRARFVSRDPS
jgi:hypothetical protein